MKLEIGPHAMRIVTETIQDVAYLKHMGYYNDDQDIYLKVNVTRLWDTTQANPENAEITIKWEHKKCDGCEGASPLVKKEFVQAVSGPKYCPERGGVAQGRVRPLYDEEEK